MSNQPPPDLLVSYMAEHGMKHLVGYMAQHGHPEAREYLARNA